MEKNTWYSYQGILSSYNPLIFKYIILTLTAMDSHRDKLGHPSSNPLDLSIVKWFLISQSMLQGKYFPRTTNSVSFVAYTFQPFVYDVIFQG